MSGPLDIRGRTAVVVGGTSGLGRTIALGFAEAGANVVATGRRLELVRETADEIAKFGPQSLVVTCDVCDPSSLTALRDAVVGKFGGVDILVNAAGRTLKKPTAEITADEWNEVMEVNLTGVLRTCQSFYEPLKASGRGRIINLGSLSGFTALHEVAAYGASKSGLLSLTRSLGCEWAKDEIRTNALVPGVFVTDLNRAMLEGTARGREFLTRTPMGRFGDARELVGAAIFLASDAASFVTGIALPVDGGFLASGVNS